MGTMFYVILIAIIFICLVLIAYIISYNKIQNLKIKINESETVIDEEIRKKYDFSVRMINLLNDDYNIKDKSFKDFDKLKDTKISNFDIDRKITEVINVYKQAKTDIDDKKDTQNLKDLDKDLRLIEEHLESAKLYYNNNTSKLNAIIMSFPSNIVAKIHRIKPQAYFDGKNLFDDNVEDFKL